MDKISVIIPVYNEDPELLTKCIESVQREKLNTEIIVVDDGSTDPVAFADTSIKVIGSDHKGAAAARNKGVKESTGDFIFFFDADSILLPGGLQILFECLKNNPDRDFSFGKYYFFDKKRPMLHLEFEKINPTMQWIPGILRDNNYISTMALVRRGVLDPKGPFDEDILRYHDWDLWLTMADNNILGYGINHYIFKTLMRKDGITGSQPDDLWRTHVRLKHNIPRVALFTLTRDRGHYTRRTVKSVRENAGYPFFWLCVDNGSTVAQPFETFDAVHKLGENRGLKWGTRKALELLGTPQNSEYDYICKIDNDVEVLTDEFLRKLLQAMMIMNIRSGPATVLSPVVEGLINTPVREDTATVHGMGLSAMHHLGGICCLASAVHWLHFQQVDYPSTIARGQDTAFSEFTRENGGKMYYLEDCKIEHMDGTERQEADNKEYFARKKREEGIQVS